jgi:hypothetical protein
MNSKIYLIVLLLALVTVIPTVIPTVSAQLSLGVEANQEIIEVKLNKSEIVNVKHVITASNMPVSVNLFDGVIPESITVTNENGNEKQFGLASDGKGNQSITIFPSKSNIIIKYDLEDASKSYENLWTVRIGYSETFSVLFSEEIDLFFLNNNIIQLQDKNGISINGGGNALIQYYDKIPKITEEVRWEENKFDVEIISNSEINKFNFDQASKSISFQVNEKNKWVTVTMEEGLLDVPYVILLNDEQIRYTKYINKENYVSLSIKPQAVGEIMISNSEYTNDLTKNTSNDTLPVESISNDYFIWLVFGGVLVIVVIVAIIIIRKIKK